MPPESRPYWRFSLSAAAPAEFEERPRHRRSATTAMARPEFDLKPTLHAVHFSYLLSLNSASATSPQTAEFVDPLRGTGRDDRQRNPRGATDAPDLNLNRWVARWEASGNRHIHLIETRGHHPGEGNRRSDAADQHAD